MSHAMITCMSPFIHDTAPNKGSIAGHEPLVEEVPADVLRWVSHTSKRLHCLASNPAFLAK